MLSQDVLTTLLREDGPMTVGDLSAKLKRSAGSINNALLVLVEDGFVARTRAQGRRGYDCRLTRTGRARANKLVKAAMDVPPVPDFLRRLRSAQVSRRTHMPPRQGTKERAKLEDAIVADYKSGHLIRDIATASGRSPGFVYFVLDQREVPRKRPRG